MGTAVSIRYISPIFGAVFAVFLLKENIKYWQWLCFAVAFCGVLILKGFDTEMSILGIIYVMLSAIFTGLVYILIRKIGNNDSPIVVVNYFMVISTIIGGVLSINFWITPVGIEWLLLLSLGVFGFFAQYYMTKAMQASEVNFIAPLKYIEVIFTMLIGLIWLGENYTVFNLIGVLFILIGLTLNTVYKGNKIS